MPVSRLTAEGLAERVAVHYGRAEVRILQLIARHLEAGSEAPGWAEAKLGELQAFRRHALRIVAGARADAVVEVVAALQTAYLRGAATGQGDIDELGVDATDMAPVDAGHAIRALAEAEVSRLEAMDLPIVRAAEDAYRDAVTRAVSGTLTGATTRLQDAQVALDDLARRGVTGFVDTKGRRWAAQTYIEMATRTTTAQASVQGHLDRLEQAGLPLVIVSDSSRECETCRPWEGKVLSRGPVASLMRNVVTGAMEPVKVDGTVAEATAAGLFHPNCTHNLSAYLPGATKRGATGSPKGYAEKVEQRRLERKVREWKRLEAVALTPEAKRQAAAKVKQWQGAVKDHTAATGLPRKRNRESLTAAR